MDLIRDCNHHIGAPHRLAKTLDEWLGKRADINKKPWLIPTTVLIFLAFKSLLLTQLLLLMLQLQLLGQNLMLANIALRWLEVRFSLRPALRWRILLLLRTYSL